MLNFITNLVKSANNFLLNIIISSEFLFNIILQMIEWVLVDEVHLIQVLWNQLVFVRVGLSETEFIVFIHT